MGALAALTGILGTANQAGEAGSAVREEKQARADKIRSMDTQDAYLQLAKQAESRQKEEFEQRKKSGDLHEFSDGRIWSVSQQKFLDDQGPDPQQIIKDLLSNYGPDTQREVGARLPALTAEHAHDRKGLIGAVLKNIDEVRKGKNGPLIVDGRPAGVIREGKSLTPSSPEWSKQDQSDLDSYMKTYKESEDVKNSRIKLGAETRVEAYMKTRMYGALDASTGSLVYVNPSQISKEPGRYAPPGPAIQAKNRNAIFNEIDTTKGFLKQALAKLPDDAFNPEARAQIAYVLKDDDPRSAWQTFKQSSVATTLTPEQIDYVTALVSLGESAMSLRSLAGMGSGSDMLRGAIQKMLPGANTPSREYAMRQLKLFEGEVNALKTSVPNIGEPGMGGGETQGTGQPPPGAKIIKWDDVK